MIVSGKRVLWALPAVMLLAAVVVGALLPSRNAYANQITVRSLTLQAGTDGPDADSLVDGGSQPSGHVNHLFKFTVPSVGDQQIGSVKFQYCTDANINIGGTCTTPSGLSTTSAAIDDSGSAATGFSIVNTTNGSPYITRTAAAVTAGSVLIFNLTGVVNPDNTNCGGNENCTFFVRITTYASTDTTGPIIDSGTVAASTSTQIVLTGTMPESLIFCTGGTVSVNGGGIPDCSTATSGSVTFNQLFSPTATAFATSQMAASTNALSGYVITANGTTLTSGANTIPAMTTAATSSHGIGQFGLNLTLNDGTAYTDAPNVTGSANTNPSPNGSNFRGQAKTDFDTAGTFTFNPATANIVAASDNGSAGPTDSQIFTASYIVNVSGSQPAGSYTTTLTYICTPTF